MATPSGPPTGPPGSPPGGAPGGFPSGPPPDSTRIIDLFGPSEYNNFGEPTPFTNQPRVLIGFVATFLALSWLFVCPRLYVRLRVVKVPGLDDLFVLLYLIFTSIASITFLVSIKFGSGRHFLLLTIGDFTIYLKLFYYLNINLNLAATFIKLSLLCQFMRLFDKHSWSYRASVAGIVVVTLWGTAYTLLSLFPCSNIADAWNLLAQDARCWGYASQNADEFTATLVSHNIINTIFDIYITAIPFQLYFQPGVTLRQRLGLMVLLLMGATVVTLSVWRVRETIYYKSGWYPTHDPTWYGPQSILLIVLEINIASICASVPIFWPVLRNYLGPIFVTREFKVETEVRDPEEGLQRQGTSSSNRTGSEEGLNEHYKDTFVMDLVDPFGKADAGVQNRIEGDNKGKKKGWFCS